MWTLIGGLASSASGIIALLVVVGGLVAAGAFGQHKLDESTLDKLKLSYATAEATAVAQAAAQQKQVDAVGLAASSSEAAAQNKLATTLRQELANAPTFKTVASACVPYGFVRVLDAAASGRLSASLTLPAGKSDDACAPTSWAALERSVVTNYYAAGANAEQLNQLIAVEKAEQKVLTK
jgi:hypothetical protein